MNLLKYELRQMFDDKRSFNPFDDTEHLEEGLLERIVNLSILNPSVFPRQQWAILAVKSSLSKAKLAHICGNDRKLSGSAVCLIILKQNNQEFLSEAYSDSELLKMSIMYASKYYAVDSHVIMDFNIEEIKKYFNIEASMDIKMLVCLGYFENNYAASLRNNSKKYSQAVREV